MHPGTTDVLISGLRVTAAPGVSINDLVCLGHGDDTQTALDQQPRRITFTGNTVLGNGLTKRGIAIHGVDITVLDNRGAEHRPRRAGLQCHRRLERRGPVDD